MNGSGCGGKRPPPLPRFQRLCIMFDGSITCKKLSLYFNVCTAQKVNRESFLLLKEDDLKEMLPLVGP